MITTINKGHRGVIHTGYLFMKKAFAFLLLTLVATASSAKVTLPRMFGDGMVLQRETNANLWGQARKNATVKVSPKPAAPTPSPSATARPPP